MNKSNGDHSFDMRMRVVILKLKVRIAEFKKIFHFSIDVHARQRARRTAKLEPYLFHVIGINMRIAQRMHKIARFQARYLCYHHQQKCVRSDVERHSQKYICTALVELQTQTPLGYIKLKESMTGRELHIGQISYILRTHNDTSGIGITAYAFQHLTYLVDMSSLIIGPTAPLIPVDGA